METVDVRPATADDTPRTVADPIRPGLRVGPAPSAPPWSPSSRLTVDKAARSLMVERGVSEDDIVAQFSAAPGEPEGSD